MAIGITFALVDTNFKGENSRRIHVVIDRLMAVAVPNDLGKLAHGDLIKCERLEGAAAFAGLRHPEALAGTSRTSAEDKHQHDARPAPSRRDAAR